ncbi:MAG TPA: M56 family metallopeptidase [Thermoanaerobaculia bacterium]|nr:M56 family metallopeptidase [Thermoanaerobaculia bacterium]
MSLLRDLASSWGESIASHLWSSTIWIALVLLAATVLRPITARTRCTLLLLGVAKFAVPSAAIASLLQRWKTEASTPLDLPLTFLASPVSLAQGQSRSTMAWLEALFALWIAVALFIFVRWLLTRWRLAALAMRTAEPPSVEEVEALTRARARVGVRQSIDIVRSSISEAPAVLRVVRPVIVLPAAGLDPLDRDEMETLLAHECAHVRRADNLIGMFEAAIWSLFWFHPLLWIAHSQLARAREQACDEVVAAGSERTVYLKALAKICRLAVVPRIHGVSCMASAKLKERIDHVMNYPTLHSRALPHRSITALAVIAFALITIGAALVSRPLSAGETKPGPYAFRIDVARVGEKLKASATITENATGKIIASPTTEVRDRAFAITLEVNGVDFEILATGVDRDSVDGTFVAREGSNELQRVKFSTAIGDGATTAPLYSGEPISMNLKDADLRDVLKTFGNLTGLEMRVDEGIEGKVTVSWVNVPWDQAFDTLLKERGLSYRIEKGVIYVRRSR